MRRLLFIALIVFSFLAITGIAQSKSPSSENSNQLSAPAAREKEGEAQTKTSELHTNLRDGFRTIAEGSRTLIGWALAIVAASIAAIVSTSYLRPLNLRVRLAYLLFVPGWVLISLSIYYGDSVSRRYMAAVLTPKDEVLRQIGERINHDFASQMQFFQIGLLVFSAWLLFFLFWWILGNWSVEAKTSQEAKREKD